MIASISAAGTLCVNERSPKNSEIAGRCYRRLQAAGGRDIRLQRVDESVTDESALARSLSSHRRGRSIGFIEDKNAMESSERHAEAQRKNRELLDDRACTISQNLFALSRF